MQSPQMKSFEARTKCEKHAKLKTLDEKLVHASSIDWLIAWLFTVQYRMQACGRGLWNTPYFSPSQVTNQLCETASSSGFLFLIKSKNVYLGVKWWKLPNCRRFLKKKIFLKKWLLLGCSGIYQNECISWQGKVTVVPAGWITFLCNLTRLFVLSDAGLYFF